MEISHVIRGEEWLPSMALPTFYFMRVLNGMLYVLHAIDP
jgi:hypothetical protein